MDNFFHFPDSCLVEQRIAKALFAENGPLTPLDRRTFRNEIEEIVCSYILDGNHGIMLTPYLDEEHDYTCLTQIDVFLRKPTKALRVAELCHRAMPYPLIVILHDAESLMFSMAEKRFSRDGREQVVLERSTHTDWLEQAALTDFCKAADFAANKKIGFRDLYLHYMALLEVVQSAAITGEFNENGLAPEERHRLLEELRQLRQQLDEIKSRAKNETELPKQVEINLQARHINCTINEICEKLKK